MKYLSVRILISYFLFLSVISISAMEFDVSGDSYGPHSYYYGIGDKFESACKACVKKVKAMAYKIHNHFCTIPGSKTSEKSDNVVCIPCAPQR